MQSFWKREDNSLPWRGQMAILLHTIGKMPIVSAAFEHDEVNLNRTCNRWYWVRQSWWKVTAPIQRWCKPGPILQESYKTHMLTKEHRGPVIVFNRDCLREMAGFTTLEVQTLCQAFQCSSFTFHKSKHEFYRVIVLPQVRKIWFSFHS